MTAFHLHEILFAFDFADVGFVQALAMPCMRDQRFSLNVGMRTLRDGECMVATVV